MDPPRAKEHHGNARERKSAKGKYITIGDKHVERGKAKSAKKGSEERKRICNRVIKHRSMIRRGKKEARKQGNRQQRRKKVMVIGGDK